MNVNFTNPENKDIPHPERVYLGSGELNLACSKKKTVIILAITACIFCFLAVNAFRYLKMMLNGANNADDVFLFLVLAIVFICGSLLNILKFGDKYRWEATGREFTITRKNCAAKTIFYKETILIEYEDLKFLRFIPQGYFVTVRTVRDTYEFKYVFPGFGRKLKFEDTPFGRLQSAIDGLREEGLDKYLRETEQFGDPLAEKKQIDDAFLDIFYGDDN